MGYIASKLKQRIQIQTPVQTPGGRGELALSYEIILNIWAELIPVSSRMTAFVDAIRGQNANTIDTVTHNFRVRYEAVKYLGKQFGKGFGPGFDSIEDLAPLKSEYFVFMQRGSTIKGRRFRIRTIERDDQFREFIRIGCQEIEETGTGYQIAREW
jgi:head-tail adaptor